MRRIDVWLSALVCLSVTSARAAPADEGRALPGVIDEPSEPPPDVAAPSEPSEPPSDVAAPSEPSEPPADVAAPSEPSEPPADVVTPSEPTEPTPTPATPPPAVAPAPASATPPPAASSSPAPASASVSPTSSPAKSSAPAEVAEPEEESRHRGSRAAEDESESDEDADEDEAEPIKHKGFIIDLRAGAIGCTKTICDNHGAKPGFRLDGLLGRNFFGFFDLGLAGAWGTMGTSIAPGTSGLALYGLDPAALPPEAELLMFDQFTVNDARLETIQAGLDLRVHILPRGRFDPHVGVGAQYSLLRGIYDTPGGSTRMGFHGLAFPLQAGFVVFATKRIAFGAQFDWLWSWYGGITIRGAPGDLAAPIPVIKDAAAEAGIDLPGDLPNLWTAGGVIHLRLGRD